MPAPGSSSDAQAPPTSNSLTEEFALFYRGNYQRSLNFVRYRAAGADGEAMVAEAFLVTWQHFQRTGSLSRGWLYGVLRNKIGDFYRSAQRREILTMASDALQSVADFTPAADARIDVVRALRALPASHSEPLILVYWGDLTGAEAARALGVSEGSLRVRLHRARSAFLKELDPQTGHADIVEEVTSPWTA